MCRAAAIALTLGELVITDDLIVLGPGRDVLAVDGGGSSRVFTVQGGGGGRQPDAAITVQMRG